MASTNQSPEYTKAQGKYLEAKTNEERLRWLEEMIKECPKHKSAEKMMANLKTRAIALREKIERIKKTGKGSSKQGIKKEELQAVIVGFTNSGKSSLLSALTNSNPDISQYPFTTKIPMVGMTDFNGTSIQIIEVPALESEFYDRGIAHTTDLVLALVTSLDEIKKAEESVGKTTGKKIIVFNKIDLLSDNERRKIESTLKSKKYDFVMISAKTHEGLNELKEKMFYNFGKIRVFTKEPGKERSTKPMILEKGTNVGFIAKKILRELSKLKETKIWGPSSKFPGQVVGLNHQLKDMDVIEFKTR